MSSFDGLNLDFTRFAFSVLCLIVTKSGVGTYCCIFLYCFRIISFKNLKWGGARHLKIGLKS